VVKKRWYARTSAVRSVGVALLRSSGAPMASAISREGTETQQRNRTIFFRLTRTAPASYPATSSPPLQARAAYERSTPAAGSAPPAGGAGDLGPAKAESSARGCAGSPLDHVPSAPLPWRADSCKAQLGQDLLRSVLPAEAVCGHARHRILHTLSCQQKIM